jgi:hypothetical protein
MLQFCLLTSTVVSSCFPQTKHAEEVFMSLVFFYPKGQSGEIEAWPISVLHFINDYNWRSKKMGRRINSRDALSCCANLT